MTLGEIITIGLSVIIAACGVAMGYGITKQKTDNNEKTINELKKDTQEEIKELKADFTESLKTLKDDVQNDIKEIKELRKEDSAVLLSINNQISELNGQFKMVLDGLKINVGGK